MRKLFTKAVLAAALAAAILGATAPAGAMRLYCESANSQGQTPQPQDPQNQTGAKRVLWKYVQVWTEKENGSTVIYYCSTWFKPDQP